MRVRKRLRVAFIDQVGKTAGGAERNLAIFLAQASAWIDPTVLLFEDGDYANELRELGLRVKVVRMPNAMLATTREGSKAGAALALPLAILRCLILMRHHRIDLVYTNSMKAHFIGGLAAWLAGKPTILHFHDYYEGLSLKALRMLARLVSRERIACSRLVAKSVGVGSTHAIYGPVDMGKFAHLPDRAVALDRLGIPGDLPLVALIGRINRWKGHDRFLRIAARVNARIPARFVVVGEPVFRDADFLPELHTLASTLELGDRLQFVPWLDDLHDVFAAITINTNCSTREPFGRSIPEAAAAGLPTVCFKDSGVAETIVDGIMGRTIAPWDESAFADAIVGYLSDERALRFAATEARRFATSFDAVRIALQTLAVIRRAAPSRFRADLPRYADE